MPRLSKRDAFVAGKLVEGVAQRKIAKEVGLTQQAVSYIANKDNVREIVERAHSKLINSTLSTAVANIDFAVNSYQKTKDSQLKEHGYKASEKVLEAAGLLSSHAQSIVHQTYINQQTNVMNPVINDLISKHFEGYVLPKPVWEEDVIEAVTETKEA